jgi:hypothetical protein
MRISDFIYPPNIARCQHIKVNGVQCGSPALKNRKKCHFHQRWQQGRIQLGANHARRSRYSLELPILEDANSIQVALMQGLRLLLTNQVDHRTAALLFYALQTASSNLSRTTFEPRPQQVVIDPHRVANTSLGDDAWYKAEFEEEADTDEKTSVDIQATIDIQAMADDREKGSARLNNLRKNSRMFAAPWKSGPSGPRRSCNESGLQPLGGSSSANHWLTSDAPRLRLAIRDAVFRVGRSIDKV